MSAVVRGDSGGLASVVEGSDAKALLGVAIRHKCAGRLWVALDTYRIKAPRGLDMLPRYCAFAMSENIALQEQCADLCARFETHAIDCAVLKGGARLQTGDRAALCTRHYDIDVLVPAAEAERAVALLRGHGYTPQYDTVAQSWYRAYHHHRVPLILEGEKPVELHVALAPPGDLSLATSWDALAAHLKPIAGSDHVFTLDPFARALHLAIHGAASGTLRDAVALAELLRDHAGLRDDLIRRLQQDTIAAVALLTVVACADDLLAGGEVLPGAAIRNRSWIERREELPVWLRARSQFVDAWYQNGGSPFGRATYRSFVRLAPYERMTALRATAMAVRTLGRLATSVAAAAMAAFL